MAEAIAVELLLMAFASLLANLSKGARIGMQQAFFEAPLSIRLLMPPFLVNDTPAVTQQIAVPTFASTDATIVHFDGTNRSLHIVVGAWKPHKVVTLHQPRP